MDSLKLPLELLKIVRWEKIIDNEAHNKLAEDVELRLNTIKVKIAEYCEDLTPEPKKISVPSNTKKEFISIMAPVPEHSFTDRIAALEQEKKSERPPQQDKTTIGRDVVPVYAFYILLFIHWYQHLLCP